jgi:hypothetical protein
VQSQALVAVRAHGERRGGFRRSRGRRRAHARADEAAGLGRGEIDALLRDGDGVDWGGEGGR